MILLLVAWAASVQAAPASEGYGAVGKDSSWTLTIADGRMRYEAMGRAPVSDPVAAPEDDQGMVHYRTRRMSLSVMPGIPCRAADGRRYTDSVYAIVQREELSGCGGQLLPADSIAGTSWVLTEIDGEATELTGDLLRDSMFMIDFGLDGFVGYGGCNRFSGGYSQSGEMVTPQAPWGRGTRNCGPPRTERETRLLRILAEPVRISRPDAETMVLTGEPGIIRLRRVPTDEFED